MSINTRIQDSAVIIIAMAITSTVLSYWDLAHELKDVDSTIAWCRGRGLLSTRHDCACGRSSRIVKRQRYPGKCVILFVEKLSSVVNYRRSCLEMSDKGVPKNCIPKGWLFFQQQQSANF